MIQYQYWLLQYKRRPHNKVTMYGICKKPDALGYKLINSCS